MIVGIAALFWKGRFVLIFMPLVSWVFKLTERTSSKFCAREDNANEHTKAKIKKINFIVGI
ncbi:hypothetical protein DXN04_05570 [Chitinophaga silvisoli]|uniref:Uncharacterized protein n=1 Tax=Chitinophaga silvisoli TaxID=2291814 RepID=A0A3E1P9V3_9BACT|nr:hypothetical protein DXN04_05570 [Chitinophaga silvisoli]